MSWYLGKLQSILRTCCLEVFKALSLVDPFKACGPDCILGRLLKEGAPRLSEPLVTLFQLITQVEAVAV